LIGVNRPWPLLINIAHSSPGPGHITTGPIPLAPRSFRLILGPFSTVDSQGAKYQLSEKEKTLSPGSVLSASKDGLWIRTGDGALRVIAVQPAGKRTSRVEAFVQGYPIKVGDILE